MEHKHNMHFFDRTDRGADYIVTIQEIIEILLIIQTFVFSTKYQQFHYINDMNLKMKFFQFHFNFFSKSSPPVLSNREQGHRECIWMLAMCIVFQLINNLYKILWGSKHCTVTQTTHTNVVGLFFDTGW